jgi:PAS domain-containing protein
MTGTTKQRKQQVDAIVRKTSDNLLLPIVILELTGRVVYMNDAAREILPTMLGKASTDMHAWRTPGDTNEWLNHFNSTIESGMPTVWQAQHGNPEEDPLLDEPVWIKSVFSPVFNRVKRIEYVSIAFVNIDAEIKGRLKLIEEVDWLRDVLSQLKTRIFVSVLCAVIGGTSWLILKPIIEKLLVRWPFLDFGF